MKTKVEINGYEIEIEFVDGVINVVASKEGETVEEFSIETEEGSDEDVQGTEEIQAFSDFDEEEDFEDEMQDEMQDEDEDEEEGEMQDEDEDEDEDEKSSMAALESFQSFLSKTKKRK